MFSCKSQKKKAAEEAAAAQARKIAKAKADLEELLSDNTGLSLDERETRLNYIKGMNIEDPEVQELITQVEQKLAREREVLEAREQAERLKREREERLKQEVKTENKDLDDYFMEIARASSTSAADKSINQALGLFASDETPVLIIISREGDIVDYDRPTTIRKYLEYIKDRKVVSNAIENVVYDSNGKITELELIKK